MQKQTDWVKIGPWRDECEQIINELRMTLHVIPISNSPLVALPPEEKPPVKEPTNPPVPATSEDDEKWKLMHYKTDGWKFRVREISGGMRLLARKKIDGKWKDNYIGSYRGRLKKLCAELGIKVAGKS